MPRHIKLGCQAYEHCGLLTEIKPKLHILLNQIRRGAGNYITCQVLLLQIIAAVKSYCTVNCLCFLQEFFLLQHVEGE